MVSNNNSICNALQSSPTHVAKCDPYCGEAHRRAMSTETLTYYKCHAGLHCFTMPIQIGDQRNLAVIGGRAFVTGAEYRVMAERFITGDLKDLHGSEPLSNVIFAEPAKLDRLAERLQTSARQFNEKLPPQRDQRPTAAAKSGAAAQTPEISTPAKTSTDLQREIDQLRGELEYRSHFAESLRHFLERISSTDPQKTYNAILTNSKELLLAERASLLV
ncbi:MAG TPA: PocR ligand-binding domain-containing protein, partial [Pyrinomonadaceae bacterium]|nr:PocR ligand-binding domain-containing protein [Pyrinomonadaceae bacterium]